MDFPHPSTCLTFPVHKHCLPPPSSTPPSLSPGSRLGLFLTEWSFSLCLQRPPGSSLPPTCTWQQLSGVTYSWPGASRRLWHIEGPHFILAGLHQGVPDGHLRSVEVADFLYELLHMKYYNVVLFLFGQNQICFQRVEFCFTLRDFIFPSLRCSPASSIFGSLVPPACMLSSLMLFQIHWGATLPLSKSPDTVSLSTHLLQYLWT